MAKCHVGIVTKINTASDVPLDVTCGALAFHYTTYAVRFADP